MGWSEDHINAVAMRWHKQYKAATDKKWFMEQAQKTLARYGWSEKEIDYIFKKATATD